MKSLNEYVNFFFFYNTLIGGSGIVNRLNSSFAFITKKKPTYLRRNMGKILSCGRSLKIYFSSYIVYKRKMMEFASEKNAVKIGFRFRTHSAVHAPSHA